jgi:hypothetical protein
MRVDAARLCNCVGRRLFAVLLSGSAELAAVVMVVSFIAVCWAGDRLGAETWAPVPSPVTAAKWALKTVGAL